VRPDAASVMRRSLARVVFPAATDVCAGTRCIAPWHVVNTSWAVLSLVAAGQAARDAVGSARNFSNCPPTHLPALAS
jgi:hypothetical protein